MSFKKWFGFDKQSVSDMEENKLTSVEKTQVFMPPAKTQLTQQKNQTDSLELHQPNNNKDRQAATNDMNNNSLSAVDEVADILNRRANKNSDDESQLINNRFLLKEQLGEGGMGMVFRALDLRKQETGNDDPFVAIKILSSEFKDHPSAFVALQREAHKSQILSHPNIITVYDFDRDGDRVYLTMEELKGKPLDKLIESYPRGLPLQLAIKIITAISKGLAYAHHKNIVHADLKPANIFLTHEGDIKIIDFGIAKMVNELDPNNSNDQTEIDGLTYDYASVEMLKGKRIVKSDDVYALSLIALELLMGKHPFDNRSAVFAHHKQLKVKRPSQLKSYQWQAIKQGLEFERAGRLNSAVEFRDIFTAKGRLVRHLSIGLIAISLVFTVSLFIPRENNVDHRYDELNLKQQAAYNDNLQQAQVFLDFNDWNNALAFIDQAYAILPEHSRTKEAIDAIAKAIVAGLEQTEQSISYEMKQQQINELLKYQSLKQHPLLIEYLNQLNQQ